MYNTFAKKDYGQLWAAFIQTQNQPDKKEWEKKVYVPGQYQPVKTKPDNYQAEVISQDLFDNQ